MSKNRKQKSSSPKASSNVTKSWERSGPFWSTFQTLKTGATDLAESVSQKVPSNALGLVSCFASGVALGVGASYLARRAKLSGTVPSRFDDDLESRPVIDVMTELPIVCTAETPLAEVAQRMVEVDCGAIPIVEDEGSRRPIGIITDRDIVVRTLAENRNPMSLVARDCMTPLTVTVPDSAQVFECVDLMRENAIRRLVVVDENGYCVGIVAQADIALEVSPEQTQELVGEVSAATGTTSGPVAA